MDFVSILFIIYFIFYFVVWQFLNYRLKIAFFLFCYFDLRLCCVSHYFFIIFSLFFLFVLQIIFFLFLFFFLHKNVFYFLLLFLHNSLEIAYLFFGVWFVCNFFFMTCVYSFSHIFLVSGVTFFCLFHLYFIFFYFFFFFFSSKK